jgi:hypothetical protein
MFATFMLLVITVMLRWRAKVQDQAAIVRDRSRTGPRNRRLRAFVHPPPRLVTDVRNPGAQDCAAMHPVQMPGIGKVRQVAPDRLQGHIEAGGQILDHHPALGPGQFQNLGLAEVQRHGSSFFCESRVPAFCHAVVSMSATFSLSQVRGILRLQQVSLRLRNRTL